MRDIFEDLASGEPLDPTEAARRAMRPQLPKRFYREVTVEPVETGHALRLDGKTPRTPARLPMIVPAEAIALPLAAEWARQDKEIDPATMPLTRLVTTIIDGALERMDEIADDLAKYAGSDLLCYRAGSPAGLVERQARMWDPVLESVRESHGICLILSEGVMFVSQPPVAIAAIRAALPKDPWRLAAMHSMTTLTGSVLLALSVAEGRLDVDAAWAAAHVDEDWNAEHWGEDALAMQRRVARRAEMDAAAVVLAALRPRESVSAP